MVEPRDQRIEQLEFDVTHQQRLLDELNQVVTDQTRQLMRLERAVQELKNQHRELRDLQKHRSGDLPHEKPPHY